MSGSSPLFCLDRGTSKQVLRSRTKALVSNTTEPAVRVKRLDQCITEEILCVEVETV